MTTASSEKDQEPILLGSSPTPVLLGTLSGAGHRNPLLRDQQQGKHHLVKQEVRRQGSGHNSVRGSWQPGSFSSSCPSPLECWLPPGADYPHVLTGWLRHFQGTLPVMTPSQKEERGFPFLLSLVMSKEIIPESTPPPPHQIIPWVFLDKLVSFCTYI